MVCSSSARSFLLSRSLFLHVRRKRRWFVLAEDRLFYFKSFEVVRVLSLSSRKCIPVSLAHPLLSQKKQPKGIVPLDEFISITEDADGKVTGAVKPQVGLLLETRTRKFFIRADNDKDVRVHIGYYDYFFLLLTLLLIFFSSGTRMDGRA